MRSFPVGARPIFRGEPLVSGSVWARETNMYIVEFFSVWIGTGSWVDIIVFFSKGEV